MEKSLGEDSPESPGQGARQAEKAQPQRKRKRASAWGVVKSAPAARPGSLTGILAPFLPRAALVRDAVWVSGEDAKAPGWLAAATPPFAATVPSQGKLRSGGGERKEPERAQDETRCRVTQAKGEEDGREAGAHTEREVASRPVSQPASARLLLPPGKSRAQSLMMRVATPDPLRKPLQPRSLRAA